MRRARDSMKTMIDLALRGLLRLGFAGYFFDNNFCLIFGFFLGFSSAFAIAPSHK